MSNLLISAGGIIILLGVVILVHEWGHFIVARLCGVRVDVFSVGMGPRVWGFKRGDTDYRISAVPIGGYARMAGENPAEERAGGHDEFLSKKRWQRALIILAGPTMNILLALIIATAVLMTGNAKPEFMRHRPKISVVAPGSPGQKAGLRSGDVLLEVHGKKVQNWDDVVWQWLFVTPGSKLPVVAKRDGRRQSLEIQTSSDSRENDLFGYPVRATVIDKVQPGKPAATGGLQHGDRVVAVDGNTAVSPELISLTIQASKGKPLPLTVERDGHLVHLTLHPIYGKLQGQERWMIGAYFAPPATYHTNRFASAIRGGIRYNVMVTAVTFHIIYQLVQRKANLKQVAGPVGIAEASSKAAHEGLMPFLNLVALISLELGIFNLLPIPILDGWHLLTLGVEGTMRRDLSLALKERALQLGVIFLLLLILVVTYNDILRLVTGSH